jgi:hypothetical protein
LGWNARTQANATGTPLDLAFCEIVRVDGDRIAGGDMY